MLLAVRSFQVISWLPFSVLLSLYGFAAATACQVDQWPVCSLHDPRMGPDALRYFVLWTCVLTLVTIIPYVVLGWWFAWKRIFLRNAVIAYVVGWSVLIAHTSMNYCNVVTWYFD